MKKLDETSKPDTGEQLKSSAPNSGSATKPPLGVPPEIFYEEQRLRDLAAGIFRYVSGGYFGGGYGISVGMWCDELSRRLRNFI